MNRELKPILAVLLLLATLGCSLLGGTVEPTATIAPTDTPLPTDRPLPTDTPTPTFLPTFTPVPTHIPTEAAKEPRTLVICMGQEPDSLYLYGTSMSAADHIHAAIYDASAWDFAADDRSFSYQPTITEKLPSLEDGDAEIDVVAVQAGDRVLDADGEPVELAEGVRIRPAGCRSSDCAVEYTGGVIKMDQMVATFTLVDGLTWADGTPVTAGDSVYSFELASDPLTPNPSRYAEDRTASYEALDDKTIVWKGLPGLLDSTYFVNIWVPLPEHAWGDMTAAKVAKAVEASRMPMGYGPFTVESWEVGESITLVKNEHYFRADEGLPKVDEIVFRIIGEDPNVAIAALLAGECDVLTQDTNVDEIADLLLEAEEIGELKVHIATGTVWEHMDFGINPVESYGRPDFFEDKRVRQAIAMCLDRQTLVDELLYGRSEVINSYVPDEHPLYNPDVKRWPYDPAAAQALLEEVGWKDENGDGVREAHGVEGINDGTRLAFKWSTTTAQLRVDMMRIFQTNLKECGIDVTLDSMSADVWFADGPVGPLFGRHFDLGEYSWMTWVEPPCDLYLSTEIPTDDNGWAGTNAPGYINPEFDQACNDALQSLPGTDEYRENHLRAQEIFAEDLPTVPLFMRLKIGASRPEVVGFEMDSTAGTEMWNIENFDLEE
jgi:peptide/nickel transport system substrate-binding protein